MLAWWIPLWMLELKFRDGGAALDFLLNQIEGRIAQWQFREFLQTKGHNVPRGFFSDIEG